MPRFTGTRTPPTVAAPYNSGDLLGGGADRITGVVFCNQGGSLIVEQSISGEDAEWDLSESIAVVANTGKGFSVELLAPYYRIRFTPTADAATFRLAARTSSAGPRG